MGRPPSERGRSAPDAGAGERLDSWKEIGGYLRRSVRTVQRWERTEALPVRRLRHEKGESVYAFAADLDRWWSERSRAGPTSVREGSPAGAAGTVGPAIVVLPFADLSAEQDQGHFAQGVAEELIHALSRLEELRVLAGTSTFALESRGGDAPSLARQIGADVVVEGSVRKAGRRLRISAKLIDAREGFHIWSASYDRKLEDVFAIQEEIAEHIADAVRWELLSHRPRPSLARPCSSPKAYDWYLKGRFLWNRRRADCLERAIACFSEAIREDPDYPLPYVGLADAYEALGAQGERRPHDCRPRARQAALKALELEPRLAEAHASLGSVLAGFEWDWEGSEREFRRAIELNPGYATAHQWYGGLLTALGRSSEAGGELLRAEELDPLSPVIRATAGWTACLAGDQERAIELEHQALELSADFHLAHLYLAVAHARRGEWKDALDAGRRSVDSGRDSPLALGVLGRVHGDAGQRSEAQRVLRRLEALDKTRYVTPYARALVHVGLREDEAALDALDAAWADRSDALLFIGVDPLLEPIAERRRFRELLVAMRLSRRRG